MKSYTKNGVRYFTCKRCGLDNWISVSAWRKKPQRYKNVCDRCLEQMRLAKQEARERSMYGGYYL